jgi:alpha-ketoglutarate-dependent taurine dioxygenase
MPHIQLPEPGRPQVLIEAAGEADILDVDPARIVELYKAHGALLLRGFGLDVPRFNAFARQFCTTSVVNESPGRSPIDPDNNIHSVDGGVGAFSLHPELSREPWKPDAAFFACFTAPSRGGATTFCDGVELVRAMPEAVRRGLEHRRLLHIKQTWPELLEFWLGTPSPSDSLLASPPPGCPYQFRRYDDEILRIFTRPALHRPMFIDAPAFGNFLLFARFNNKRVGYPLLDDGNPVPDAWLEAIRDTGEQLKAEVAWRPGDVLMLDNSRFMHGRTAIVDPGERLIATFFGYLGFALPDPEEPPDPIWRRTDFCPPLPPRRRMG